MIRPGGDRDTMSKLMIGLPKGSLQESTFAMFKKDGYSIKAGSRYWSPYCSGTATLQ